MTGRRVAACVALSAYTTWRVGGPADRLFTPQSLDDLCAFLVALPAGEPLLWLGLGSNLLVRDGGVRGTVIYTRRLNALGDAPGRADVVEAQAGAACAQVARFAAERELQGAEFLSGIPGTLGGALAMNAGAFDGETWSLVEAVQMVNRSGALIWRTPEQFEIGYRHVRGAPGEWFVTARLRLHPAEGADSRSAIRELLARRNASQPLNLPSCGSVFRNPPGDFAARLIETAGLKGHRIGAAEVSDKHANFIVNTGGATACDIERLIGHVQAVVEQRHGIRLEPEVCVVGETQEEL